MKAFETVFTGPGQVQLSPKEVGPPGPGAVLLRTDRTLISTGTELTALSGDFPPNSAWSRYIRYPHSVGYSSVATVQEVGPGVDRVRPGDRVTFHGPHATHAVTAADGLWKIPEAVTSEVAAFTTLAEIAMGGVRRSRLTFGESVVIIGAGLVGQLATRFCRAAGAWPIIVVDAAEGRLETARAMGATHVLPLNADEAIAEVEALAHGRKADIVFEVTGSPHAFPGALKLARLLGRVVLLGSARGPVTVDLHDEAHTNCLEIIGAHNRGHSPVETPQAPWTVNRHVELFLEWQAAGVVDVQPLITHRFPWTRTPEAFLMLLQDRTRALGVILDWSSPDPETVTEETLVGNALP